MPVPSVPGAAIRLGPLGTGLAATFQATLASARLAACNTARAALAAGGARRAALCFAGACLPVCPFIPRSVAFSVNPSPGVSLVAAALGAASSRVKRCTAPRTHPFRFALALLAAASVRALDAVPLCPAFGVTGDELRKNGDRLPRAPGSAQPQWMGSESWNPVYLEIDTTQPVGYW